MLIVGRIVEAMGTGILMTVGQLLIFRIIPGEKGVLFMGLFGFIAGITSAMKSTIGGIIVDLFKWRAVFEILAILFVNFELETEHYPLDFLSF